MTSMTSMTSGCDSCLSAHAHLEWRTELDGELAAFVAAQTSCFLGTASADGRPDIQHRGGPPGFLRVLDPTTIAFADDRGHRQCRTTGNLGENPQVHLLLIDHARRQHVKVWGEARVVEDDASLIAAFRPADSDARTEQAIVIRVRAWDLRRMLDELPPTDTCAARVRCLLLEELQLGEPTLARLAARMHMSERTLQRNLGREGTSIQELLDEIRHQLSLRHLDESKESVAGISFLLGFTEVRAFHRAFKRWTGLTPAAYRRARCAPVSRP